MRTGEARVRPAAVPEETLRRTGRRLSEVACDQVRHPAVNRLLGGSTERSRTVAAELGEHARDALVDCGVLVRDGGEVWSPFRGHRTSRGFVFTDPDVEEDSQDPLYLDPLWEADLLSRLMLPRTGATALDVGCGSGVLSLELARSYDRVIAIDLNPRAHEMTGLNVALNGVGNVELRDSDLYQRVPERFDRIVFNSPTNEEQDTYRNLLEAGEGILEAFFTGLPGHLAPGGLAEVNLAMNDYPESRFLDRLRRWLGIPDSGIDAVVLVSQRERQASGREWKRGWLVATHGTGRVTELDFPYHELGEGNAEPLSGRVADLLDHAGRSAPARG